MVSRPGRGAIRLSLGLLVLTAAAAPLCAQDLSPRAYVITPSGSNAITLSYSYNTGDLQFEGAVPITDATGKFSVPILAYYRGFGLFGRSANALAVLPYAVGTFKGTVLGEPHSIYRSGLVDSQFRFSINLLGGPSMTLADIVQKKWRQKRLLGVSLKVVPPTGQYDPTKLINLGANRWRFKPELGYSQAFGRFILDGYASAWFFTKNPEFFSNNQYVTGTQVQTQSPIAAAELHLSYDIRPRYWVSLDANFWNGGTTSINGVENPVTQQRNSRVGATASFPITRHGAAKVSYAQGAYIRFGGDFRIFSVAWQYSWLDHENRGKK
ncbi:MAG TPA: transporter [Vicinamibacteria bacterium]|nr:transporter [Vicinamibacteria bacterium]